MRAYSCVRFHRECRHAVACAAFVRLTHTQRRLRQENDDLKKEREELRSTIDELNTRLTTGQEDED